MWELIYSKIDSSHFYDNLKIDQDIKLWIFKKKTKLVLFYLLWELKTKVLSQNENRPTLL
jgi:hypothetical protein